MMVIPNHVRVVVVVMVSALALVAGLLTLALLEKPAQAQAQTIKTQDRSTFNQSLNICTGEFVFIEGALHTVAHTTIDANGERHTKFHNNIQGRGEGASGAKYVFHDTFNIHENFPAGDPNYNVTFTRTVKLIRQGSVSPTDDYILKLLIHQTLNTQNELTSEILKAEDECT